MSVEQRLPQYVREATMPRDIACDLYHGLSSVVVAGVDELWNVKRLAGRVGECIEDTEIDAEVTIPLGWEDAKTIYAMTVTLVQMCRRDPSFGERHHITVPGLIAIRMAMREYLEVVAQVRGMELN